MLKTYELLLFGENNLAPSTAIKCIHTIWLRNYTSRNLTYKNPPFKYIDMYAQKLIVVKAITEKLEEWNTRKRYWKAGSDQISINGRKDSCIGV